MTPTALLILKLCAAHATQVPIPPGNTIFAVVGNDWNQPTTRTEYAPGFEECESVVPPLERQQQAEESAANAAKYRTEHADEIAELVKAVRQARKEQPDLLPEPIVMTFPTCNSRKSCAVTAQDSVMLRGDNISNTLAVHP